MVRNQLAEIDTNVFEDSLENIENKENNTSNRTFTKDNSFKSIFYEIPNTPQKHRSKISNRLKNEIRKSLNSTVTLRKNNENVNTTYVKDDKQEKIKNKKKICDVVYLKTIDNLLKAINFELDFGKSNTKFKDDYKYIEIFQENVNKLNLHLKAKLRFNAGLKIVRWYKNILEIKEAKNILNELKRNKSASIIQRNWKNYKATKSTKKLKNDRLVEIKKELERINEEIRNEEKINEELKINKAASIIQRCFKVYFAKKKLINLKTKKLDDLKAKKINDEMIKRDQCALLIQKKWKSYKLKKHLNDINLKKNLENKSAVIIQRFFRKITFLNKLHRHILLNNSAKIIQKNWRIFLYRKKEFKLEQLLYKLLTTENSVSIIENNYKSYLFRKKINLLINQRKQRKEAALKIQNSWLRYNFANKLENRILEKSLLKNKSAVIIQKNWKCYLAKKKFINLKADKIKIKKNKSASIIQRNWRKYLLRKEIKRQNIINEFKRLTACRKIQRFWRNYKIEDKKRKAAIMIQKTWRGYITRYNYMKNNKDVSVILERINEVNKNAQSQATVGEQTKNAIQKLLTYKYHGTALHFLKELEKTTNLSDESCLQMIDYQIIEILLKVVSECNRSDPCLEIIKLVYSVIMNIAKHEKALPLLSSMKQLKESIIDTLIKHHKKTSIFLKCMTLLYILLKYENFPESPAITVKMKRLLSKISANYKSKNKNQKKVYEFDARWCSKKYARIQFYTTKQAIDAFHFIYL